MKDKKELLSFGCYTSDTFMDDYLLDFLVEIKNLGVKYNDPFTPHLQLKNCIQKMENYMESRGPLDWY